MPDFSVGQQVFVFFLILFTGLFSGIIFDFFRVMKNVLFLPSKFLFLSDLIVSLVLTLLVFKLLLVYHWGEMRAYIFISFFGGIILYYLFWGRYCTRVFYRYFRRSFKIVMKIISFMKDFSGRGRIKIRQMIKYFGSLFRKEKQL
ncbi:MAG: spore cortex biosynthesis protein YabQ [Dethiobacteria bacterium]